MEENKINEIGKMSLPAKVCCIIKAIGSYWSFAAPFVSALSDFQNYKQNRLIEDVLKKAFTMIEELDNRVAHPTNPVECCADANPKTMLPNDT